MGWDVSRRPASTRVPPRGEASSVQELSRCCAAPLVLMGEGRHRHFACSGCHRPASAPPR